MFSRKRQSRIWTISVLYKYLNIQNTKTKLMQSQLHLTHIKDIPSYMYDELIFSFDKGDIQLYQALYNQIHQYYHQYDQLLTSHIKTNNTMISILLTMLSEMHLVYIAHNNNAKSLIDAINDESSSVNHDLNVIIKEYINITFDYTDTNESKIINQVVNLSKSFIEIK